MRPGCTEKLPHWKPVNGLLARELPVTGDLLVAKYVAGAKNTKINKKLKMSRYCSNNVIILKFPLWTMLSYKALTENFIPGTSDRY